MLIEPLLFISNAMTQIKATAISLLTSPFLTWTVEIISRVLSCSMASIYLLKKKKKSNVFLWGRKSFTIRFPVSSLQPHLLPVLYSLTTLVTFICFPSLVTWNSCLPRALSPLFLWLQWFIPSSLCGWFHFVIRILEEKQSPWHGHWWPQSLGSTLVSLNHFTSTALVTWAILIVFVLCLPPPTRT